MRSQKQHQLTQKSRPKSANNGSVKTHKLTQKSRPKIRKQLISQKNRKLTQNQDQNPQVKIEINTGPISLVTEVEDWPEGGQARASLMTGAGVFGRRK